MQRIVLSSLFLLVVLSAYTKPTHIVVRARARDAKFIGTGIGGAFVTIRNNLTGEILAKGLTTGASGNTNHILLSPHQRNERLSDSLTAGFETTLNIDEPVFVDVEVQAPFNRKTALVKTSTQLWLVPGGHITGDGIVVEVPGFILDIVQPRTHQVLALNSLNNSRVEVRINLVLMCGCAISKGGTWNADNIDVKAVLKKDGIKKAVVALAITPENNVYNGWVDIEGKGNYELEIYAYDRITWNTGVDKINFVVQ